ncbi:unnamed protein product [Cyclocybe aegerita]|uniref:Uncharacterized protein n=1 Tax=Cyclocybe aegerita TaxID=1973307 RepID=A0A8S0W0N2_CYCAE|nr:unnamed protein product [Cyclocybe aegerita]
MSSLFSSGSLSPLSSAEMSYNHTDGKAILDEIALCKHIFNQLQSCTDTLESVTKTRLRFLAQSEYLTLETRARVKDFLRLTENLMEEAPFESIMRDYQKRLNDPIEAAIEAMKLERQNSPGSTKRKSEGSSSRAYKKLKEL